MHSYVRLRRNVYTPEPIYSLHDIVSLLLTPNLKRKSNQWNSIYNATHLIENITLQYAGHEQ